MVASPQPAGDQALLDRGSIYNEPAYYPGPAPDVLVYAGTAPHKQIVKTDLPALIVKLTSPLDTIDYAFLSDFFLSYRKFISSVDLLRLLISRFQWTVGQASDANADRKKTGEVTLIRTFVVLRHWVLNYFTEDFLASHSLRQQFVDFVNILSERIHEENCPRVLRGVVVSVKKTWILSLELAYQDFKLEELPTNFDEWLSLPLHSFASTTADSNKSKRLSFYALQSTNDPHFRNRSVLSLYNSEDKFQLTPKNEKSQQEASTSAPRTRTASMFLFPKDNFFTASTNQPVDKQHKESTAEVADEDPGSLSKQGSIGNVIKHLDYPNSSSVQEVIPPTPAKNVEFILRSSYLPPEARYSGENTDEGGGVRQHKGIVGLLKKWRNDNKVHSESNSHMEENATNIDNMIKYVFSITSMDVSTNRPSQQRLSFPRGFDILSARTIDEVEFLVAMRNELRTKVHEQTPPLQKVNESNHELENGHAFSAIDNLNLYQTVSSIATSVLSLSKTLHQQQLISPTAAVKERRIVMKNKAITSRTDTNLRGTVSQEKSSNTGKSKDQPEKLVFYDIAGAEESSQSVQKSSSPLKGLIGQARPMTLTNSSLSSPAEEETTAKTVPQATLHVKIATSGTEQLSDDEPRLKRKLALSNLREFNFEEEYKEEPQVDKSVKIDLHSESEGENGDDSSFFTSFEEDMTTLESKRLTSLSSPTFPSTVISSGRISIQKSIPEVDDGAVDYDTFKTDQTPLSRASKIGEDVFTKVDNELKLQEAEIDRLEKHTSILVSNLETARRVKRNSSDTRSIATELLFPSRQASRQASPNKARSRLSDRLKIMNLNETPKDKSMGLAATPSIQSIISDHSSNSFHTIDTFKAYNEKGSDPVNSVRDSAKISLENLDEIEEQGIKYLFSPDNESVDCISPERNVENLRNKFLSVHELEESDITESSRSKGETTENGEHHRRTITPIVSPNKINESKLDVFASIADESIGDDPINTTLMKLQGLYEKESKPNGDQDSVNLATEVEELGLKNVRWSMQSSRPRNSMFIDRRRRAKSDTFLTPTSENETEHVNPSPPDINISELLLNYVPRDSRLHAMNSGQHIPFILMYDSVSVAQQLTLIERDIILEIDWKELADLKIKKKVPEVKSWLQLLFLNDGLSGLDLAVSRFNLTVEWIISEIVLTSGNKLRRNVIQRFIHIAEHCRNFQNYNTLMQIVLALSSITVQRFKGAWILIEPGDLLTWQNLRDLPSLERNYRNMRVLLNDMNPMTGCIPFLVVYLSDLTLNAEKRDWIVPHKVLNYGKFQTNIQIVKNFILRAQWSKFYQIKADDELLSKCVYITCLSPDEIDQLSKTNSTQLSSIK
ncbi:LAMI_0F06480g1_1 [Lachancea mirantina]|uniref:Guanine nucleotide exchange factor LTE1 n=1 Tax=Lachancea mirantina TaxID=1230905 RepID=A0A1G4JYZ5_9SACH|nr:LAMI_0F06480g1_1 [Lachancea mirantina]